MRNLLLTVFAASLVSVSFAQNFEKILVEYHQNHPQEKIYIHYDKPYYSAGETIWFKAYFYLNGYPSGNSSNFHLQLIDPDGQVIRQKQYAIGGATTQGNIDLSDSLPEGFYTVRAGTPQMLETSPDFLYAKQIFVANARVKSNRPAVEKNEDLVIRFYPESGDLVDGILTTVGFTATDGAGRPMDVAGTIKTPEGVEIPLRTYRNGMGRFLLRGKAGRPYVAEVNLEGKAYSFNLPEVKPSGINLRVQDEKGGKLFQLSRSNNEKQKFEILHLVVRLNNSIVYDNRISFDDYPSVKGHLLTDSLPSGILHFTVFSEDRVPLAERLAFVNNGEYKAAGDLTITEKGLGKREKNSYRLKLKDAAPTTLSVSVTDAAFELQDNENIYTRLLLTSDLKGYIQNPAQYFKSKDDSTMQSLDNLMMIQGWSRYKWQDVLAGKSGEKKSFDYLMNISGQVADEKSAPVKGGSLSIFLEAEDSSAKTFSVPVGPDGSFLLDSVFYAGNGKFFYEYQAPNGKVRDAVVKIREQKKDSRWALVRSGWMEMVKSPQGSIPFILQQQAVADAGESREKQLDAVVLTSKHKRPEDIVNETYSTGFFQSMGRIVLDNINQPAGNPSQSVVNYIEQNIRTIRLDGQRFVNTKNFSMLRGQNWEVGILLNETPNSVANVRAIRMDEVALIKFYETGFPGVSSTTPGGAIAIYLKNGGDKPRPQTGEKYFEVNGYSVVREFYHPDYAAEHPRHASPDLRTTLYWNPAVFTSSEKPEFDLNFYNNDYSRKLKVIVEGFDAAGKLIHLEKVIN